MKIVLCPSCGTGVIGHKRCPNCKHRIAPMSIAVPFTFSIIMMSFGYLAGIQVQAGYEHMAEAAALQDSTLLCNDLQPTETYQTLKITARD